MKTEVVFGIPGSGKTTYLLNKIDELIQEGYEPKDIAYLTMTRNARAVAKKRMADKFGATKDDLRYFRTMHSICWELIGRPTKVSEKEINSFCKKHKVEYQAKKTKDGETYEISGEGTHTLGGLYFAVYNNVRLVHKKNMSELNEGEFDRIWIKICRGVIAESKMLRAIQDSSKAYKFLTNWEQYKQKNGVVDFPDMLKIAFNYGENIPTKVLIVDEFQDLCPLMYEIYKQWKAGKEKVIIAGDDDQAIYSFMGAKPKYLLNEKETADLVTTLDKSYRCPAEVLDFASKTIHRNVERHEKEMLSTQEGGSVEEAYLSPSQLKAYINQDVDTLMLARTNSYVKNISADLIEARIPFRYIDYAGVWTDKFINVLNAVVKLTTNKQIEHLKVDEFAAIVNALPSTPYLRRGAKKELKELGDIDRRRAIGLGFFTLTTKKEFAAALKLTDAQREILSAWGFDLVSKVKVRIGTIHKAKGDEAVDVFLYTQLPERIMKSLLHKSSIEEERRVRYVGLTRSSSRTILVRNNHHNDIKHF